MAQPYQMVDKTKYIERIKALHLKKTGTVLSDRAALDCFEKLVALVAVIYQPIPLETYAS